MKWLIGAASSCDLVIDEPGVSAEHCMLNVSGSKYVLEDRRSTNGTWVNGTRIKQPTAVSNQDRIGLGQQTTLPTERWTELASGRVLRIGRDSDNDIVVDDDRVSAHHAKLIILPSGMTLVDLNSTNGLSVGTADNRITRQTVERDQTIYFGSYAVPLSTLLASSQSPSPSSTSRRAPVIAVTAAAAVVAVFTIVQLMGGSDADQTSQSEPEQSARQPAESDRLTKSTEVAPSDPTSPTVFAVVARSGAGQPGLRIGTAFHFRGQYLATSGSVVLFLEQSRNDYPLVSVRESGGQREWPVQNLKVHPECRRRFDRLSELRTRIDDLRNELADLSQSPSDAGGQQPVATVEDFEARLEQLVKLEDEWFTSSEEMIHFDAGLLELQAAIPLLNQHTAAVAIDPTQLQPGLSSTLVGTAFDDSDAIVSSGSTVTRTELEGELQTSVTGASDRVPRWTLRTPASHLQKNWMGAPVAGPSGRIIGLYSRPTPALKPDQPPSGESCDVVAVQRLLELISVED